jgi:hypothetical protein
MKHLAAAAAAAFASTLACAGVARATPNFPPEVASHLKLDCPAPPCTICHRDNNGGTGTAIKPFATTMKMFGLVKYDTGTLDTALDDDVSKNVSSINDGVPDITKLKMCLDPNEPLPGHDAGADAAPVSNGATNPTLAYGCGAQVAGGSPEAAGGAGLVLVGLALTARRGRRGGRRDGRRR